MGDGQEREIDYAAVAAADAERRAHDAELAALADLALIRSGMTRRPRDWEERESPPSQEELEARLRDILADTDRPGR